MRDIDFYKESAVKLNLFASQFAKANDIFSAIQKYDTRLLDDFFYYVLQPLQEVEPIDWKSWNFDINEYAHNYKIAAQ